MAAAKKIVTTTERTLSVSSFIQQPGRVNPAANLDAEPTKPRRGRPPSGEILTAEDRILRQRSQAAERKQRQRGRDQERNLGEQSVEALLKSAGQSMVAGRVDDLKVLNEEMLRRAQLNAKHNAN